MVRSDIDYNKCYIGSTCEQLSKRMARHRKDYRQHVKNGENSKCYIRSMLLFDEYGIDNCKIELIENFPCNSREELLKQEGKHIRNNECINRCIAGRTSKEYYNDTREHQLENVKQHRLNNLEKYKKAGRDYYETHKEQLREYKRNYYKNNEEIKQQMKTYRENNRQKIRDHQNEYYHANKEEINRKRRERRKLKKQEATHADS